MIASAPNTLGVPRLTAPSDETMKVKAVTYEIAHHVRGRVRFGIPRLSHDAVFAQRLSDSVAALPTVKRARVNRSASSLIVDYRVERNGQRQSGQNSDNCASLAVLPGLIECIRTAADADVTREMEPPTQKKPASDAKAGPHPALPPHPDQINYVRHLGLPALGLGLSGVMVAGLALPGALVGAVILAAAVPHAMRAVRGLREEKRLTVEVLDVTAAVLLVAQSSFLASAFMISVIEGAEVVRMWTARRGRIAGLDLLVAPDGPVAVERDGRQEHMAAQAIVPGDTVLLLAGDLIPVDGMVQDGSALVDQREVIPDWIGDDAAPVARQKGDIVYAGTRLVEGHLSIVTTHVGPDTHAAKVLAQMHAEPKPDTRVSNYARKTGNWAVVPTLALGGAVGLASSSIARAAGIVSLDFGLGMRVSAPIAILTAQNDAVRKGILIRSGRAVEMLGQVDTILFNQTAMAIPNTGSLRAGSAQALAELQEMKADLHIYSSAGEDIAQATTIAAELGVDLDHMHAGLLPQQKADLVATLQASGRKVAFVGDGINDAAAMAQADVAVSLGSVSAVAREAADVVLWNDDLRDLPIAMGIARHALRIIKQNQAIVVGINSAGIAYGALAFLNPIAGVVLNNGVALVAALNSLRSANGSDRTATSPASKTAPA